MINYILKNLILLISLSLYNSHSLSYENKIVIKVENKIITSYEVKNKIKTSLFLSNQIINQKNIDKTKRQALSALINIKLKQNEISNFDIEIDDNNIKQKLLTLSSNDIPALKENFKKNNLNYQIFLDEIKTELTWQKIIFVIYNDKVKINNQDLKIEIDDIIKNESNVEEYKISEIELPLEKGSDKNIKINFVIEKIKELGFEDTALRYSTSSSSPSKGNLGWINTKALSSQIYNILNKLNIGEISEPIVSLDTVLFLKLDDKKITKINNLDVDKLKSDLISQKRNELFNLYSRSHLSKIKNNSLIEYK
jgi:peptidyl-prolyl cis-trans isomerase SurA